jgi:hypothetical protein
MKEKWLIKRDGKVLASLPKESEAFGWLLKHYPISVSHAIKYEGFEIVQSGKRKIKKVI